MWPSFPEAYQVITQSTVFVSIARILVRPGIRRYFACLKPDYEERSGPTVEIDSHFSGDYPQLELERKLEEKRMSVLATILAFRSYNGGIAVTNVARPI